MAYLFANHGLKIPYPNDQVLFISHPVYDYQLNEELSIAAYYTPFKEEGFPATQRIIFKKDIPCYVKEQAYQNSLFYVKNLKSAHFEPITIQLPLIGDGPSHYNAMNPSIQKVRTGYKLICRTVNYQQTGGMDFKLIDPADKYIKTKNFLVHYDKDLNLLSQHEIVEELPRKRVELPNIVKMDGLEDGRLFEFNKKFWFTCTSSDTHPLGYKQISLCKLADKPSDQAIYVEKLTPLKGPNLQLHEKNWLPFVRNQELYLFYSYDPWIIYKPNIETGECEQFLCHNPGYDFSRFRGSAAPIEFDNGYLMLVHEVVFKDVRYYLHRFLFLDKNLIVKKISNPFTFMHKGVEYCCGMTLDHSEKKLLLPIGIEDRDAYFCSVDTDTVRAMLEPLPKL